MIQSYLIILVSFSIFFNLNAQAQNFKLKDNRNLKEIQQNKNPQSHLSFEALEYGGESDTQNVFSSIYQWRLDELKQTKPMPLPQVSFDSMKHILDIGKKGALFTSAKLTPETAVTAFPYAAAGKLFFKMGDSSFVCSAAVIQYRLVLTAGHCVHQGTKEDAWAHSIVFIPAYHLGDQPYKAWNAVWGTVSKTWSGGGGKVPNGADYAILEMEDLDFEGTQKRIGEVTGWFGTRTKSLSKNIATMLGYPVNFDQGQKMHQVVAQSFLTTEVNTVLYGSDMQNGASGGPWIMNFGNPSEGQTGLKQPDRNLIIGVTSYGVLDSTQGFQASSIFDERFTKLYQSACLHREGNCK